MTFNGASELPPRIPQSRLWWWAVAAGFLVPLLFAAYTNHAWEDYYITLRSSRNLVEGHGLVYQVGERVHTFTSPLGVLLPALCLWVTGGQSDAAALWLFRLLSCGCLAATAGLLWRLGESEKLSPLGRFALLGVLLTDAKLIDFTINGMETGLLALFVTLTFCRLRQLDRGGWVGLAVGYAGLMWTRPDGFIYAAALTVGYWVFGRSADQSSAANTARKLAKAIFLGGACYAPWFFWAWYYYGSPVPHTIIAKAGLNAAPPSWLAAVALSPFRFLGGGSSMDGLFLPTYHAIGNGWPTGLVYLARGLAVTAGFAWMIPRLSGAGRHAAFALLLGSFYLLNIPVYPWYFPGWVVIAAIALGFLVDGGAKRKSPAMRSITRIAMAVVLCIQAGVLVATARQMRTQQRLIEEGVRHQIGTWLHGHAQPNDTVFLEPLGYIGYFSQLKMLDYPGLCAPEVVQARHEGLKNYAELVARLRPTWIVLREQEYYTAGFANHAVIKEYRLEKSWNVRDAVAAEPYLPGRGYLDYDAAFLLFRRRDESLPGR